MIGVGNGEQCFCRSFQFATAINFQLNAHIEGAITKEERLWLIAVIMNGMFMIGFIAIRAIRCVIIVIPSIIRWNENVAFGATAVIVRKAIVTKGDAIISASIA